MSCRKVRRHRFRLACSVCKPEVKDFGAAFVADHDVFGLQITMSDSGHVRFR